MFIFIDINAVFVNYYLHYKNEILRGKDMGTYAVADAIEKLADNFKYAIGAMNQIEKEKLAFEKEKFEFNKQQLDINNERYNNECKHDWHVVGSVAGTKAQYKVYVCSKCGAQQTEKTIIGRDGTYDICLIDETND